MRETVKVAVVAALSVFVCGPASAGGAALTAKAGTLGFGADLTIGLSSHVNARVGANAFNFDMDVGDDEGDGEELNTELDWQSFGAMLDWHPWGGIFRITVGALKNNNEVHLSAEPGDSVDIGDGEYVVDSVEGTVSFDDIAPYIGIGLGNAVGGDGHWHVALDLGVMLQGEPDVTLRVRAANPLVQPYLDADVERETQDLEDDLKPFDMYPVVSLGVSYRF